MIENVREAGMHDVSLVRESAVFHHGSGALVVRKGEGDDSPETQFFDPTFSAASDISVAKPLFQCAELTA